MPQLLILGSSSPAPAHSCAAQVDRLAAIDGLMAAMRARLRRVEAAILHDIAATRELHREEGPLAGHNTAATNTAAAPTPLPGASSTREEEGEGEAGAPAGGAAPSFGSVRSLFMHWAAGPSPPA